MFDHLIKTENNIIFFMDATRYDLFLLIPRIVAENVASTLSLLETKERSVLLCSALQYSCI